MGTIVYSSKYQVHDLRYYITRERFKSTGLCKVILWSGALATFVCGLLAIVYTGGANALVYFNVLLYWGLNSSAIDQFNDSDFDRNMSHIEVEKDFPEAIPINVVPRSARGMSNMYGFMIDSDYLFKTMELALLSAYLLKEPRYIDAYGDREVLTRAMEKIHLHVIADTESEEAEVGAFDDLSGDVGGDSDNNNKYVELTSI